MTKALTKALTKSFAGVFVLLLVAVLPARGADAGEQPYIVLVGIDDYADKQIKPRQHSEADAKALYDLLTDKNYLGADANHVRLLLGKADRQVGKADDKRPSEPATHDNILKALQWAAGKAGREDLVIVGLFLQGAPKGELGCYFATDSTFKDRAKNAVAASEIAEKLKGMKSERFCVFLDVNFMGFDAGGNEPKAEINVSNLYKEFLGKDLLGGDDDEHSQTGRIVFLANAGSKPSLETEQHGLLAQTVLDALKGGADKEGYEPDGLVTVDELLEYLEKEYHPLVLKYGKTKEDKEQSYHVLGGRSSHFTLTRNPAVTAKVRDRLDKLARLAGDGTLTPELADEGKNLLGRMPKLEARRTLRKSYQKLADGDLAAADFLKERTGILDGMKFKRGDALSFAAKVIQATQEVRDNYVKELNQGDLVAGAVRGLYQVIDENIPQDIKERLEKVKDMKEADLTVLLADVRERLGKREDLDKHKDIDHALQGMLSQTKDRYSAYIDPETLDRFREETEARFPGIGIQIRKDEVRDALIVVTPLKDSPAYKAGLKAGDVIVKIKREMDSLGKPLDPPEVISTKGLPLPDAVKKIKGKEGTKVKLTVEREGVAQPKEIEITRGLVEMETVLGLQRKEDDSWDYNLDKADRIGYVRLTSFAENTFRDLAAVLSRLGKKDGKGLKGLVLDLRFNPGGQLSSARDISDLFIDDGLIVTIRPRVGRETAMYGEHDDSYLNFPMVCLINGGSASGSEIVAACLQDHHRALVIGERSYGKGSVQTIQNFEGGKLKLTTASYWRPNGKNIHKSSTSGKESDEWGVLPDKGYVLKLSPKEREDLYESQRNAELIPNRDVPPKEMKPAFKDKQLDKALEYLRRQIKMAPEEESAKKAG